MTLFAINDSFISFSITMSLFPYSTVLDRSRDRGIFVFLDLKKNNNYIISPLFFMFTLGFS